MFVPPHKLIGTLEDAHAALGDRRCSVCRELTKVHEEFWRSTLSEARAEFERRAPRGEITLVIEGYDDDQPALASDEDDDDDLFAEAEAEGEEPADAEKEEASEPEEEPFVAVEEYPAEDEGSDDDDDEEDLEDLFG